MFGVSDPCAPVAPTASARKVSSKMRTTLGRVVSAREPHAAVSNRGKTSQPIRHRTAASSTLSSKGRKTSQAPPDPSDLDPFDDAPGTQCRCHRPARARIRPKSSRAASHAASISRFPVFAPCLDSEARRAILAVLGEVHSKPRTCEVEGRAMSSKHVYSFGNGKADGNGTMKGLLGGKGAALAEMTNAGIPVPPGFTITTEVCTLFSEGGIPEEVLEEQRKALA